MSDDSSSQAHPLRPRKGSKNPFRSDLEMKTRLLGRTGLKVSEIGFGAWAIGGGGPGELYWPAGGGPANATLRAAAKVGGEFILTPRVFRRGPHRGSTWGRAV